MKYFLSILMLLIAHKSLTQRFKSDESEITFFSEAPIENIAAKNTAGGSVFDVGSGEIVFSVPIQDFQFEKSLMQQHFNEKFMDSEQFPKATFRGIVNSFDIKSTDQQKVWASGTITIHGVSQSVKIEGKMLHTNEQILLSCSFPVKLADFHIKIPQLLWQNIAEEVEVSVNFIYKPL